MTGITAMMQKKQRAATPRLRFPEFRNASPWPETPLNAVLFEHGEKNDGKSEVHSVSVHKGVVNQVEHLGRSFAAADRSNYNLAKPHDIIYTKSPTGDFPYGIVKQNRLPYNVIVSPLYGVFSPINRYLGYLLDAYFESPFRTNAYLEPIIQKGAKNTIQISNARFLSKGLYLPQSEAEHKKIAECLSTLDELIEAESRKLDALKDHKKGLMQQLFPREGETRPRLRFPEFRSSPDWTTRRMNEIYAFLANNSFSRDRLNYVSGSIKNIHYGDIHKHYRLLFDVTREVVPYINDDALTSESQPVFCAEGDMVFADASEDLEDIGKCIEIVNLNNERVVAGLHTILARPKTRSAFARGFSGYLFSSKRIRAQIQKESQGTKVLGISAKRLANIELCFPVHVAEQERIADCLSSLDDLIAAQSERLEALRAHKRGLMQQLFPNPSEFES